MSAKTSIVRSFDAANARTEKAVDALDKLSPLKILTRGYFRLQVEDNTVGSVKNIKVGDTVTAVGGDGTLKVEVTEVHLNNKEQ